MSEEQKTRQSGTAESNVRAAAKTGKAVANIAKGAATGGVHGAALATVKSSENWIIAIVGLLLIPAVVIAMLPSIIFGSFFGDGNNNTNAITDDTVLAQNMTEMNTSISTILSEGLTDVLDRIDADFASSGRDEKEIINPYGSDVLFNANYFISMYCASKDKDVKSISLDDMESVLRSHKDQLYSYTFTDTSREVTVDRQDSPGETLAEATPSEPETVTVTIRTYTISYNGEAYFANHVFNLSDDQKLLASNYAQNLSVFLSDGMYQVLTGTDYESLGASYEGIVFTDGETQVVYYNQLDGRWCNLPYGTDDIGGYACGPTAMSIVVSSLTSENVDPVHMAQWAYENGYWCSQSGSYHTLIPGAAEAWGLDVEGCSASEPQRIVDALEDGKLVVALMSKGHFTSSGHFIVLRGVTSDGLFKVADPSSYARSQKDWDSAIILNEASRTAGAGGPFWIIG